MLAFLKTIWARFGQVGVGDRLAPEQAMRVRLLNQIWAGTTLLLLFYLVDDSLQGEWQGILLEGVALLISVGIFLMNRAGLYRLARWCLLLFYLVLVSFAMTLYGKALGGEISYLLLVLMSLVLFVQLKPKVVYISLVFCAFLLVHYLLAKQGAPLADNLSPYSLYYLFTAGLVGFLLIGHAFVQENKRYQLELRKLLREVNQQNQALEKQQVTLDQRNQDLRRANMELERFSHIASHDLKTPLRNIITFLELISRKIPGEDAMLSQYIGIASRSGQQLYSLIQDIGAYVHLGHLQEQTETCDLNHIFEQVSENLRQVLDTRQALLQQDPLPQVHMFEPHALLLFQNLLENGLKYNESPIPRIDIFIRQQANDWQLCFRDNGIGVETAYQDDIFEMFKRLHNQTQYPGSGLGLAICRRIVEQYHGRIWVEANPAGGSIFVMQWPTSLLVRDNQPVLKVGQ